MGGLIHVDRTGCIRVELLSGACSYDRFWCCVGVQEGRVVSAVYRLQRSAAFPRGRRVAAVLWDGGVAVAHGAFEALSLAQAVIVDLGRICAPPCHSQRFPPTASTLMHAEAGAAIALSAHPCRCDGSAPRGARVALVLGGGHGGGGG